MKKSTVRGRGSFDWLIARPFLNHCVALHPAPAQLSQRKKAGGMTLTKWTFVPQTPLHSIPPRYPIALYRLYSFPDRPPGAGRVKHHPANQRTWTGVS